MPTATKQISNDIINILLRADIVDDQLKITEQLDRKVYLAVNDVLNSIGGVWNRRAKAHIFDEDPTEVLDGICLTGEYVSPISMRKIFDFFETTEKLSDELVTLAEITELDSVLEPSGGNGCIAHAVRRAGFDCDCCEVQPKCVDALETAGFSVVGRDFLEFKDTYDIIVANPPFSKQKDIDHVNHMLDIAQRRVVSVMSNGVMFRDNKKTNAFRQRVADLDGEFHELPEGTFRESGTMVNSIIVVVDL